MSTNDSPTGSGWLRTPPTDSVEIAQRYDDWVATYESDLVNEWKYQAPFTAAELLVAAFASGAVLDVGCGTGLVGRALRGGGVEVVDGVDLSEASLMAASKGGMYRTLLRHDFNAAPLPFEADSYSGAICVGVLSYAHRPIDVISDLCRVVVPGGTVVFTHRCDLWDDQKLGDSLLELSYRGVLSSLQWTEPEVYMPGNPEYEDIRIRYVTASVV